MKGEPYGLPHPFLVQPLAEKSDNKDSHPFSYITWAGHGTSSEFTVTAESWWTIPSAVGQDPSLVIDMGSAKNLTHLYAKMDNTSQTDTGNDSMPIHCSYSYDGVAWSTLSLPAMMTSYFESSVASDSMDVYFWIPRTVVRARYWKLSIPRDSFASAFLDDQWHVSAVFPGTLDHVDGLLVDFNAKGEAPTVDLWTEPFPPDELPWVSAGVVLDLGRRPDFLYILRVGTSTYSGGKVFWTDISTLRERAAGEDVGGDYRRALPIVTETGFVTGIGTNDASSWSVGYVYTTGTIQRDAYTCFGFVDDPNLGCAAYRIRDKDTGTTLPNRLGKVPDCVWLYTSSATWFISHPDYPLVMFSSSIDNTQYPLTKGEGIIVTDQDRISGLGDAGLILMDKSDTFFEAGSYTGTGVSGVVVDTLSVNPEVLLIKKITSTDAYMYLHTDGVTVRFDTGKVNEEGVVLFLGLQQFTVNSAVVECNEAGATYLWWAWGR